jgi:glycosyltransferase involved in cell wall biosynthesis
MTAATRETAITMAAGTDRCDVLFLTTSVAIGGMERLVLSLARRFAMRRRAVRTVFPAAPQSASLLGWSRQQGVEAETHPAVLALDTPHSLRDLLALRRFVGESGAKVVNLHYGGNHISIKDVLAVRLAGRRRCVVSLHLPVPWDDAGGQKRQMTRLAAHLCDALIVNSHATQDVLLQAGVPAKKVYLIPCGVRPPQRSLPMAEARRRLGLPADAFIVGCVSRLVEHKGVHDLIEAAARVPASDAKLLLVVAGDGPQRAALEQLGAARLGNRVSFLGHMPDPNDLYAAIDLFALPTRLEGFGMVYVEAAFRGVPSIGTNTGGVPDAIADGETGLLVPSGDRAALAAAILRLRDDPGFRLRLGEAARRRAHAQLTEEIMADRYEAVLLPRRSRLQ